MRNWTVDTSKFDKNSSDFVIWRLEQLINFGLTNEKISVDELKQHFDELILDPAKRKYIKFLLSHV